MRFALVLLTAVVATLAGSTVVDGMAACHPSVVNQNPNIRSLCKLLSIMDPDQARGLVDKAVESYYDDNNKMLQMLRENSLSDSGVGKRQDVDHVFLRFGRRR